MNYLELARRTRQAVGYSGEGPSSVANQKGEMKRVVDNVNTAWLELQSKRADWRFMRSSFSQTVPAGSAAVTIATDSAVMRRPVLKTWFVTYGGQRRPLRNDLSYEQWLARGPQSGVPQFYVVDRDKLYLYPSPDAEVVLEGEFYKRPIALTENTSVPDLPDEFHMLIVYDAARKIAGFEEAGNHYALQQNEYRQLYRSLVNQETPRVRLGGPLDEY